MSWLGHAGLLLSGYCLVAVIDGSLADSSHGPFGSPTNHNRAGSYLMFAAEESSPQRSPASGGRKSGAAERQESKPSPSTAAPEKSLSPAAPEVNPSMTKSLPQAGADKPVLPAEIAAGTPAPSPAKAPSLIQRLEGREGDLMIWLAIAAVFFLVGWIGGSLYARRRERSRRTRLRF
jgi:hypothetical protein